MCCRDLLSESVPYLVGHFIGSRCQRSNSVFSQGRIRCLFECLFSEQCTKNHVSMGCAVTEDASPSCRRPSCWKLPICPCSTPTGDVTSALVDQAVSAQRCSRGCAIARGPLSRVSGSQISPWCPHSSPSRCVQCRAGSVVSSAAFPDWKLLAQIQLFPSLLLSKVTSMLKTKSKASETINDPQDDFRALMSFALSKIRLYMESDKDQKCPCVGVIPWHVSPCPH